MTSSRGLSCTQAMESTIRVFLLFVILHQVTDQEVDVLSQLPFAELLAQKKIADCGPHLEEELPVAAAVAAPSPAADIGLKGLHKLPHRKTFYDDEYGDEKGHVHKKKEEHKIHDILNTSIMALSYLAFGGYLLCMIASALREKRRRVTMAYPPAISSANNHFVQVLQHHMTHRPARPFIRFPTVTVHQGGKKRRRRRRSAQKGAPWGEAKQSPPLFDIIDYVEALAHGAN